MRKRNRRLNARRGGLKCTIAVWSERFTRHTAGARMIDDSQEILNDAPELANDGEAPRRRSRRRGRRGKSRGAASNTGEQLSESAAETPAAPQSQRPNHQQHQESPRLAEPRRPGRSSFEDGLDRQVCLARMPGYPSNWPVNHRPGLAVQRLMEVSRTAESLLLCDLSHEGPCIWPGYLGSESSDPAAVDREEPGSSEEMGSEVEIFAEAVLVVDVVDVEEGDC